ncbi:MAG: hypothetical protein KBG64_06535 [Clostridia bacterium]|nr:hypothetical protein [Clostridia bacterium]
MEKCKTSHLYDQVLRYVFNVAMCHDYLSAAIQWKKKNARKAEVAKLCDSFLSRSSLDVADDETTWAVLVRKVPAKVDRSLVFRFIDGSEFVLQLTDFSPRHRDSLMEPRGRCTKTAAC